MYHICLLILYNYEELKGIYGLLSKIWYFIIWCHSPQDNFEMQYYEHDWYSRKEYLCKYENQKKLDIITWMDSYTLILNWHTKSLHLFNINKYLSLMKKYNSIGHRLKSV